MQPNVSQEFFAWLRFGGRGEIFSALNSSIGAILWLSWLSNLRRGLVHRVRSKSEWRYTLDRLWST